MEEADGGGVAPVLAADADLEVRALLAAAFGAEGDELADAAARIRAELEAAGADGASA